VATKDGRYSANKFRWGLVHHGCNCLSPNRYRSRAPMLGGHGHPRWPPMVGGHGGRTQWPVMTNKPAAPDLAKALTAMGATGRGPSRSSPVHQWLEANYDALALAFRGKPPSWTKLANYLGEHGVTGAEGRQPTPETVRSAWRRLDAAKVRQFGPSASPRAEVFDPQLPEGRASGDEYDFAKAPFVR